MQYFHYNKSHIYVFLMNLGRTREYLKSRKNRRELNTVKIITAMHSNIKLTLHVLRKNRGSVSSDQCLFQTDPLTT